jgi:hypothetical protein
MTPADHARNQAISLEAKKDALAQRQNGDWKVSFTVQGIDMDTRLTQAPMGTRYAVVLVEIGDDELPVPAKETRAAPRQASSPSTPTGGAKREKMDWRDMQPAAQAGIRCEEPIFVAFLKEQYEIAWGNIPDAAALVRWICGVKSRSELGTNHKARVLWKQLDDQFQAWKALEHA